MLTVINASAAVTLLEQRPRKIQALSRIRTHDLCDASAVLSQLSYQSHMRAVVCRLALYICGRYTWPKYSRVKLIVSISSLLMDTSEFGTGDIVNSLTGRLREIVAYESLILGFVGSWKTWKVLEFCYGIFQDWKVLEKGHSSWKVQEIC